MPDFEASFLRVIIYIRLNAIKMKTMIRLVLAVVLLANSGLAANHTKVKLLLASAEARPGDTINAALQLEMDPGWHTYWRNPGDAGIATSVEWELPEGFSASALQWPVPEVLVVAKSQAYSFAGKILLPLTIKIGTNVKQGTAALKGKADWLECNEDTCVPANSTAQATLKIGKEIKESPEAGLIQEWLQKIPSPEPALMASAYWGGQIKTNERALIIEWKPLAKELKKPDFFAYESDTYTSPPSTEILKTGPDLIQIKKTVRLDDKDWPSQIAGLVLDRSEGEKIAYEAKIPIKAMEGQVAAATPTPAASSATPSASGPGGIGLLAALGLAFLGGLVLNIMPCVLPVIALKILSFVNQTREAPGRARKLGLLYGLGVLVSFWVLAAVVIAIQRAGNLASWGMQFQNPIFLVAITTLVVLVSLNLFGVFEVYLGGGTLTAANELATREGASGAFFNGVLATILATPCTAPALASAIGFAFAQPPFVILLIFTMVALGLAAPYVVLAFKPNWLKFLPKPGNWMVKFKMAMGFPMLATAMWLFWLSTSLLGQRATLWFGIFLVTLAAAGWIWGEFVQKETRGKGLAMGAAIVLLLFGYTFALEHKLNWRHLEASNESAPGVVENSGGIAWQRWTTNAVATAQAQGHPVLVDFTADWCLTCQANKSTSIEIDSVRQKLKEINAVTLIGDYTRKNPHIAEELRKFQRAGVPLVLVYPANPSGEPIVLPNLLTPGAVLDALDRVGRKTEAKRSP
jgi:thiol:disulfide interchange protein